MKIFQRIGAYFRAKYIGIIEYITLSLLAVTGNWVRKLIILKGKDPDYVAPPPPPPVPQTTYPVVDNAKIENTLAKFFLSKTPSWTRSGQDAWVKQPSLHPILVSMRNLSETKDLPEPQPPELTPEEAQAILQPLDSEPMKEWVEVIETAAKGEVK